MISLCRSAFFFFFFFFNFRSLRDQNHDVELLNVKLIRFKIEYKIYLSMKISKTKLRKRNKSPTCTLLQVDLNHNLDKLGAFKQSLRAYYLGDSFILDVKTGIRLANSRGYWKSEGQASYSRLIPLIFISAHKKKSKYLKHYITYMRD